MFIDCQRNLKKPFKDKEHSKKSKHFEPWSLKVVFSLLSKCFESCVLDIYQVTYIPDIYLLHIYHVVLILAILLGKDLWMKEF